jgi:hypothetical protein
MKRLWLLLALLVLVAIVGTACTPTANDRYRQMTWRHSFYADVTGLQDDADQYILQDRPTHLSPWYYE